MKKLIYTLLIAIVLGSCTKNTNFAFEEREFSRKSSLNCTTENCTEITINAAIIVSPDNSASQLINKSNIALINELLPFTDSGANADQYEEITNTFIYAYEEIAQKFPTDAFPWKATVSNNITFYNHELISFAVEYYTYSGGAHGFKGEKAIHYNPNNGQVYTNEELFSDWPGFQQLVKSQLRSKIGSDQYEVIDQDSILFDDDQFKMPEDIFIYEDSIIAYYNSFDISAFSDEPVKIEIPKTQADTFLKIKLVPIATNE
ncbi:PdaC/SigV domain-containing protein [Myroides phaeus]|uniref:Deacetylase PdaC domain-containing protein n=1 Tax=Myroides phaeus TaxID=702745 RepID=A0A1G8AXT8_9FLAO|nr:DUF4163 domain-containing protein [Myroides phaeus]MEC4115724.1 DUF4163 domain-containing protein [Myroides phaeus]SDH25674.1 protein of unknown function [Myroides phaeus]